jgi:hypothetical protein
MANCLFPLPQWALRQLLDPLYGGGTQLMQIEDGENCPTYEPKDPA